MFESGGCQNSTGAERQADQPREHSRNVPCGTALYKSPVTNWFEGRWLAAVGNVGSCLGSGGEGSVLKP